MCIVSDSSIRGHFSLHQFPPQFDALRLAFEVVQIPQSASDAIFSCLSAILHLGNLKYQPDSNIDSHNDTACLAPGDEEILHTTASLLGIETQELQRVATIRQINISGNVTEIPIAFICYETVL